MLSVKKIVRTSPIYSKVKRILRAVDSHMDLDALHKEIENLHGTRDSRTLGLRGKFSAKRVINAHLRDQSYRSRIVEIVVTVTKDYNHLWMANDNAIAYFLSRYDSQIPGRSREVKRARIAHHFISVQRKLTEMETLKEVAELVIKDIDTASWAARNALQGLAMATKSEVQI